MDTILTGKPAGSLARGELGGKRRSPAAPHHARVKPLHACMPVLYRWRAKDGITAGRQSAPATIRDHGRKENNTMTMRVDLLENIKKDGFLRSSRIGVGNDFAEQDELAKIAEKLGLRILVEAVKEVGILCGPAGKPGKQCTLLTVYDGGNPILVKDGKTVASGWTRIRAKIEALELGDVIKPCAPPDKTKRRGP